MPEIKITVSTAEGDLTHARTVSGADLKRFAGALRAHHGAGLTDAEAFDAWTRDVFRQIKGITRGAEQRVAEQAARDALVEIGLAE